MPPFARLRHEHDERERPANSWPGTRKVEGYYSDLCCWLDYANLKSISPEYVATQALVVSLNPGNATRNVRGRGLGTVLPIRLRVKPVEALGTIEPSSLFGGIRLDTPFVVIIHWNEYNVAPAMHRKEYYCLLCSLYNIHYIIVSRLERPAIPAAAHASCHGCLH
jgi:hypothetical protein